MKPTLTLLACLALPGLAAAAADNDFDRGYKLAKQKGCLECHALGYRDVGPAFAEVARRYRHDPLARERLTTSVRGGSAGHWGERFVMWPQPQLNDAEARQLIEWVLSQ